MLLPRLGGMTFQPNRLLLRVLKIRMRIALRGDNPLAALIAGTHYKAYLIANLAFNDGAQASADHYGIPLANVYGAMAFYCENEERDQRRDA